MAMPPVPMDATEYILGELGRRLTEVANALDKGLGRLDTTYVRKDIFDQWQLTAVQEHKNIRDAMVAGQQTCVMTSDGLDRRVKELEDSKTWQVRTIGVALLTALISALVSLLKAAGH